jgi:hypothetical protein
VATMFMDLKALQDESYCEKNTGEYKSQNVLCVTIRMFFFFEIWFNIIMVFEPA